MPHVRPSLLSKSGHGHPLRSDLGRFLWADPTRGALQVYVPQQFLAIENPGAPIRQEGIEEGIWITADPIPGCIVCNIGESPCVTIHCEFQCLTCPYVIVWEIWTNGLYKSTVHRVIHRGSNCR